jgi:hypothetical protein
MDRLRENAVVTVSLPMAGGRFRVSDFSATVIALIESGAALLPLDVAPALLPARADDVFLTFVHAGRLIGLKGELTQAEGRGARFQVSDGVQQRRDRYTRVDAELAVTVTRGDGAESCPGVTVNVAPEGLLLRAPLAVELGELLTVALALPAHAQPVELRAKVVRHAADMLAVHFGGDRRELRAAVAEFVVERRAAQLLAAREPS